ncbi:MAG: AAA family ATPase, partial [Chloroflexota bacterium]|nr:AAA family ATPase [Chloroflexota bacterium]
PDPGTSFVVDHARLAFRCSACGRAGDLVAFAQEWDGLSFRESVDHLAELAGLPGLADAKAPIVALPSAHGHLRHLNGAGGTLGGMLLQDVEPERIEWLSLGRFAAGKTTMVDGDPGLGKSTVLLEWAARITRGDALPGGMAGRPRGVVVMSAEDGVADTIRPRAEVAGADLGRVLVVTDRPDGALPTIPEDIPLIEDAVRRMDAALLIVDPLVAYLGDATNANRDQDVRRALAPLKLMAERTGVAIALIRHLNKMAGANALYRGGGSIGLIGAARFGLLFARDPDDEERCVVAPTKANLSRMAPTLAYRLESVPGTDVARVEWLGESTLNASTLLTPPVEDAERGALDEARDFLLDLFREGPVPAKVAKREANDAGISEKTLRNARESLGVVVSKSGFGREGFWEWSLPSVTKMPLGDTKVPKVTIVSEEGSTGHLSVGSFEEGEVCRPPRR